MAASPCALVIAIPIAYLSAISVSAKRGILLKGGAVLDQLANCKILVFDKTGTLTHGELTYLGLEGNVKNADEILRLAYSLELNAKHPIAAAIAKEAVEKKLSPLTTSHISLHPGFGLSGIVDGKEILVGNLEFISNHAGPKLREEITKITEEI